MSRSPASAPVGPRPRRRVREQRRRPARVAQGVLGDGEGLRNPHTGAALPWRDGCSRAGNSKGSGAGGLLRSESCNPHRAAARLRPVLACTTLQILVHTTGRPERAAETLGSGGPKSVGFSARPRSCRRPPPTHSVVQCRCVRIPYESLPWPETVEQPATQAHGLRRRLFDRLGPWQGFTESSHIDTVRRMGRRRSSA